MSSYRPRYDANDHARRLDQLLRDLGYADAEGEGWPDWRRAHRIVSRRTRRPMKETRFHNILLGEGLPLTADEAVQLAEGLGVDVRRLLYDEGQVPRKPERPRNLLDELDSIGNVFD